MERKSILVCGKAGVGKSTLVNSILGEDMIPVGDPGSHSQQNRVVASIQCVKNKVGEVGVTVYEAAFFPEESDPDVDECFLPSLSAIVNKVQLILYCFDMTTTRWLPEDEKCIQHFTNKFGKDFWSKTIVVLTKTNLYQYGVQPRDPARTAEWEEKCEKAYSDIKSTFQDELKSLLPEEHQLVDEIPVISAGCNNKNPEERNLIFVAPGIKRTDYLVELMKQCDLKYSLTQGSWFPFYNRTRRTCSIL